MVYIISCAYYFKKLVFVPALCIFPCFCPYEPETGEALYLNVKLLFRRTISPRCLRAKYPPRANL